MPNTPDLDAIEARATAATEPTHGDPRWWYEHDSAFGAWLVATGREAFVRDADGRSSEDFGFWLREEDAAFVAHARQDVPELVAEVRRLRAVLREIADTPPSDDRDTCPAVALEALS